MSLADFSVGVLQSVVGTAALACVAWVFVRKRIRDSMLSRIVDLRNSVKRHQECYNADTKENKVLQDVWDRLETLSEDVGSLWGR